MRRFFLVAAGLVLCTAISFGQSLGIGANSHFNHMSFGLFANELDAISDPLVVAEGPRFGQIGGNLLVTGLSNLADFAAAAALDNHDFTIDPLTLGFYLQEIPLSVLASVAANTGGAANPADRTLRTYTDKTLNNVVNGSTTTTPIARWLSQQTIYDYTRGRLAIEIDLQLQGLLGLTDSFIIGAFVRLNPEDTSNGNLNYNLSQTTYYDAAAAGVQPDSQVDYTLTETRTQVVTNGITSFAVPIALLSEGGANQKIVPFFQIDRSETSDSFTRSYSSTSQTNLGALTQTNADGSSEITTDTSFGASYLISLPRVFGEDDRNGLQLSALLSGTVQSKTQNEELDTIQKTFAGGGAAATDGTANRDSIVLNYKTAFDWKVTATLGHRFYVPIGDVGVLGLLPLFGVSVIQNNPLQIESATYINRVDTDNDGTFDDATDTITTHSYTYQNTALISNDTVASANLNPSSSASDTNTLSFFLNLPASVRFMVPWFPLEIVLGTNASVGFSSLATTTRDTVFTGTQTVAQGDNSATTVSSYSGGEPDATTTVTNTWTVSSEHRIGFKIPVSEAVSIYSNLDVTSGPTSILEFKNFHLEAVILLP